MFSSNGMYEPPGGFIHAMWKILLRMPHKNFGDLTITIFIPCYALLSRYRCMQPRPQAISRNAITNSSAPTGNMAVIRIPRPNASAQMPMKVFLPHITATSFLRISVLYQYIHRRAPMFRRASVRKRKKPAESRCFPRVLFVISIDRAALRPLPLPRSSGWSSPRRGGRR